MLKRLVREGRCKMGNTSLQKESMSHEGASEFRALYEEYKKGVFAIALSILRDFDLAEDVLQESFIKLFQQMKYEEISNVKGWLFKIARTTALDVYRKKRREVTGFGNDYFEKIHGPSSDPLDAIVLTKYLELLDQEERQIVVMKDITGLKHREIADLMELPLGTILWKYGRAIRRLRKSLG